MKRLFGLVAVLLGVTVLFFGCGQEEKKIFDENKRYVSLSQVSDTGTLEFKTDGSFSLCDFSTEGHQTALKYFTCISIIEIRRHFEKYQWNSYLSLSLKDLYIIKLNTFTYTYFMHLIFT